MSNYSLALFKLDIRVIIQIDSLIKRKATGSPASFAGKIGLSERQLYTYLKFMKEDLKAPIYYSKAYSSYTYENNGCFYFEWKV